MAKGPHNSANETMLLSATQQQELRQKHYNATLSHIHEIRPQLWIMRIVPDGTQPEFLPGQFTTIGLLDFEKSVTLCQRGTTEKEQSRLHKRAYSISHPVLQDNGELYRKHPNFLEFYIVLVNQGNNNKPPLLTPRLFHLKEGSRLFIGKTTGHYTLEEHEVAEQRSLVFCSTGTGEAPHNSMIWHLLQSGYAGRLTAIVCVREQKDLGYRAMYESLQRQYSNFSYKILVTRDSELPKQYVQDLIESGEIETLLKQPLDPEKQSFYLCGNPSMIGIPKKDPKTSALIYPEGRPGVIELLSQKGFKPDMGKDKGQIHFEKYW